MKKFNMGFAAALIAAFTCVNNLQAQSEEVINLMPASEQVSNDAANVAAEDGLTSLEFALTLSAAQQEGAARDLRGDSVFVVFANSTVPVTVYTRSIEGFNFGPMAGVEVFEKDLLPTIGAFAGWQARTWGYQVGLRLAKGTSTGDSDHAFLKSSLALEAYYTIGQWSNGHDKISVVGAGNYTKRHDTRANSGEVGDVVESSDLFTNAETIGFSAGLRFDHKSWAATGLNYFVEVKGGFVTDLNINNNDGRTIKPSVEVLFGVEIFPSRGKWNTGLLSKIGMSKEAVKAAARKAVANY